MYMALTGRESRRIITAKLEEKGMGGALSLHKESERGKKGRKGKSGKNAINIKTYTKGQDS